MYINAWLQIVLYSEDNVTVLIMTLYKPPKNSIMDILHQ